MDKIVCQIAVVLVIIGALNWGLIGAFKYNAVTKVTDAIVTNQDTQNTVERTVYVLVGLAALVLIYKKLVAKRM